MGTVVYNKATIDNFECKCQGYFAGEVMLQDFGEGLVRHLANITSNIPCCCI